jgi:Sulfotransferase family
MISDERRCIFVHIPRCAGTSIENVVWPGRRSEEDLWMGFVDTYRNKYQTGGLQHLHALQIRQEVGGDRFTSYFKFAVVRNPFDRTVSQFSYMRRRPDLRAFIGMREDASFGEYVGLIRRRQHVQWEPQCSFLYDVDGTLLVDHLARFESLKLDVAPVFERLGMSSVELPHDNASDRTAYRDYYTPDLRSQVEDIYSEDLERLGYKF